MNKSRYEDIIALPRPASRRSPMSAGARAAQFAPFAALSGYDEAVDEAARRVERRIELSEEELAELDLKTRTILENPDREVILTYFVPDLKKDGGHYVTKRGEIKCIDELSRRIIFRDGTAAALRDVLDIEKA